MSNNEVRIEPGIFLDLGFDITFDQAIRLASDLRETLEWRIGLRIAEDLTKNQLDQFDNELKKGFDAGRQWLEKNYKEWRSVTLDEYRSVLDTLGTLLRIPTMEKDADLTRLDQQ